MVLTHHRRQTSFKGAEQIAEATVPITVRMAFLARLRDTQGDRDGALELYRASLDRMARVRDGDPQNADVQRFIADTMRRIGVLQDRQGKLEEALATQEQVLAVLERLVAADPENAGQQAELAGTHGAIAVTLVKLDRRAEARERFRKAADQLAPLIARSPDNARWQDLHQRFLEIIGLLETPTPSSEAGERLPTNDVNLVENVGEPPLNGVRNHLSETCSNGRGAAEPNVTVI